jgi:glycosyltransferase involved in cell wall biosynthesis
MNRPVKLEDLPVPAGGRSGWPWTEPAAPPPAQARRDDRLPRICVVTPSFNQAQFLEQTLRSVLLQGYPNLEYIVVDGGSTDGSVQILENYAPWLNYWVSEHDRGQVDAINKGLRRSAADWIAWQNSDDIYYPGALWRVAEAVRYHPGAALVVGNVNLIGADDRLITDLRYVRPTYRSMLAEGMVMTNQAAFWRRELHATVGWLNESYGCAFDYDWFLRVLARGHARHVDYTLGGYRIYRDTKTTRMLQQCAEEHERIRAGRRLPGWEVQLYRLRRIGLYCAMGHFGYVARALSRRAAGIRKDLA